MARPIAGMLLLALVFTTLAHGATEPWSVALFEVLGIGILVLWGVQAVRDGSLNLKVPAAAFPIFGFLVLAFAQCLGFTNAEGQRISLSLDVEATRTATVTAVFLTIALIAAANFFRTREQLMMLANVLTVFGLALAVFALIQNFTWDGRIYWLRRSTLQGFGPFVNRNHFAGYMAMLAPIPIGLILTSVRGNARLIYGFATALMGVAAVVSSSRSGMLALIAAFVFLAIASKRSNLSIGLRVSLVALLAILILAGVVWTGPDRAAARVGEAVDTLMRTGEADPSRAAIWRDSMQMVREYPVLGAGIGTYRLNYERYGTMPRLYGGIDYAHNDYVQILSDTGVVGAILAVWFFVVVLRSISRGIQSHDRLLSGLSLGAGAGIVAVAVQSLAETDLQIPSNALLFFVLYAITSRAATWHQAKDSQLTRPATLSWQEKATAIRLLPGPKTSAGNQL